MAEMKRQGLNMAERERQGVNMAEMKRQGLNMAEKKKEMSSDCLLIFIRFIVYSILCTGFPSSLQ